MAGNNHSVVGLFLFGCKMSQQAVHNGAPNAWFGYCLISTNQCRVGGALESSIGLALCRSWLYLIVGCNSSGEEEM